MMGKEDKGWKGRRNLTENDGVGDFSEKALKPRQGRQRAHGACCCHMAVGAFIAELARAMRAAVVVQTSLASGIWKLAVAATRPGLSSCLHKGGREAMHTGCW